MIKLQFDIFNCLYDNHGMDYSELLNRFPDQINDASCFLSLYQEDGLISCDKNLAKERSGFISLSSKGLNALYAEKEYREFKEATNKSLRNQFVISQIIAVCAIFAVLIDVAVTYFVSIQ